MTGLAGYIATGIISLIVGLLLRNLKPKSKIVYWTPHAFYFDLKQENISMLATSFTLLNAGRKHAESIEMIFKEKLDFFQFFPAVSYEEEMNESGNFILRVKTLGPKEFVTIQILDYKSYFELLNIRSKDGAAKSIQMQPVQRFPKFVILLIQFLILIGIGTCVYGLINAIIFILKLVATQS